MNEISTPIRETFDAFRERVKPLIRPKGTLPRLHAVMNVDARFLAEFDVLRAYLRPVLEEWPAMLRAFLERFEETRGRLDDDAHSALRKLVKAHSLGLARGRFDADYLSALEDVALFFAYHDVKSIYLAGAYQAITEQAIEKVLERAAKRGAIRVPQLIQTLIAALSLELNQMQRVFILYERSRYEDLALRVKQAAPELALEALDIGAEDLPPAELSLNAEDVALAQETTEALLRQTDLLVPAFLRRLFEIDPETRGLFPDDLAPTHAALAALFEKTAANLGDPHALSATLRSAAAGVPGLAISAGRGEKARRALLGVLQRACGLHWSERHGDAWRRIFDNCLAFVQQEAACAA